MQVSYQSRGTLFDSHPARLPAGAAPRAWIIAQKVGQIPLRENALGSRLLHYEDRHVGLTDDAFRDAPDEDVVETAQSPRAHDDELRRVVPRGLRDILYDVTLAYDDLARSVVERAELVGDALWQFRIELKETRHPAGVERRMNGFDVLGILPIEGQHVKKLQFWHGAGRRARPPVAWPDPQTLTDPLAEERI